METPKPIRKFGFKSKTSQGGAAKFEVIEYDDNTVMICKIVTAKEAVPGYKVFKSFKTFKVLMKEMLVKKSSLFIICREIFAR